MDQFPRMLWFVHQHRLRAYGVCIISHISYAMANISLLHCFGAIINYVIHLEYQVSYAVLRTYIPTLSPRYSMTPSYSSIYS